MGMEGREATPPFQAGWEMGKDFESPSTLFLFFFFLLAFLP